MLRVNNLVGFGSGGKSTNITGTNTSNNGSNDNTGTYNFSSMSVGAEASDRLIVCVIGWSNNASLTSATILGVTATEHIEMSNQSHCSALISAAVPTGTSGTISFSISPNGTRAQVTVYRLVGQLDNTPYDTDSSDSAGATSLSTSVNVVNRGFVVGGVTGGAGANPASSSNLTIDHDSEYGSGLTAMVGSHSVLADEVARTASITWGNSKTCSMVTGSWL